MQCPSPCPVVGHRLFVGALGARDFVQPLVDGRCRINVRQPLTRPMKFVRTLTLIHPAFISGFPSPPPLLLVFAKQFHSAVGGSSARLTSGFRSREAGRVGRSGISPAFHYYDPMSGGGSPEVRPSVSTRRGQHIGDGSERWPKHGFTTTQPHPRGSLRDPTQSRDP